MVDTASLGMDEQPSPLRNELELITEADACRLLKVCRRQLYNWRRAGRIPYLKIGRAVRFRAVEVVKVLEATRGA